MGQIEHKDPVFACNMGGIDPQEREGHSQNSLQLFALVQALDERADGYTLKIPINTNNLRIATEFIALERLCCPFFGFTLEVMPGADWFGLSLSGPEGVKPFIVAELGAFLPELGKRC